jgi:hypothetical protein
MPSWSLFVSALGWSLFCKCLKRNGEDDGTRTRGLCRDRSTFNDIEEHGRHCKSLEVHDRQRYCVSRIVYRASANLEGFLSTASERRVISELPVIRQESGLERGFERYSR